MCVLCTLVYSFPPAAETCARLADSFCLSLLSTVKSWANGMVWLNVLYFTARWGGGGVAHHSPYHYTTWLKERGREGGSVPSRWNLHPTHSLLHRLKTRKYHLEEVSGPVLVADIGKGLERRQERGMLPHLRTPGHCFT
jgi:hypothetical protein